MAEKLSFVALQTREEQNSFIDLKINDSQGCCVYDAKL